ncbi:hypothetical protein B0H13DRAFT_18542 [Mycena leptocephala]|nr:hypothetical protein B0H13DRAFT_18542 [Mycena leptocephala]
MHTLARVHTNYRSTAMLQRTRSGSRFQPDQPDCARVSRDRHTRTPRFARFVITPLGRILTDPSRFYGGLATVCVKNWSYGRKKTQLGLSELRKTAGCWGFRLGILNANFCNPNRTAAAAAFGRQILQPRNARKFVTPTGLVFFRTRRAFGSLSPPLPENSVWIYTVGVSGTHNSYCTPIYEKLTARTWNLVDMVCGSNLSPASEETTPLEIARNSRISQRFDRPMVASFSGTRSHELDYKVARSTPSGS